MNHRLRRTTVVLLTAILTVSAAPFGQAFEDAIIAVVNDELVTLRDLKDYAQATYASLVAGGASERQIEEIMSGLEQNGINKLIEDKLILSEANRIQLEVREELVDERIQSLEEKYGSQQKLIDALVKTGATLTDLRKKIRDEMKIKFVVDHEVRSKIYISPQDVTEYFEQNKEAFGRKTRVNLDSIFMSYSEDRSLITEKAEQALARIKDGASFEDVAGQVSESPSVGIVEEGQLLPEVEQIVFGLNTDEISPLIETDTGIFIFKLIGKMPAEIPPLDDVKGDIYDLLYMEAFKVRFTDWLAKLKDNAYIEIK